MNHVHTIIHWIMQNPLRGATVCFGAAIAVVTLYTYAHDYLMLTDQE